MSETVNLAGQIEKQLPAGLVGLMRQAGEVAAGQGQRLYLVGGVVRDLLLGRTNLDLDLVVEGDAIDLAQKLAGTTRSKITTHPRFHTAKIQREKWSIDLATARTEIYDRPGALPVVQPGTIDIDLLRRDFTINAMAVELTPGGYGRLIDPYKGQDDIKDMLIRVLHESSFIDDSTRIWRGLRYEQRLNFRLETATLKLMNRDIDRLDTISGDRIRHELELALKEEFPERVLRRAAELGVLAKLHPGLKGDSWLVEKFKQARMASDTPPPGLYLALLAYRLNSAEAEELISRLRLPKLLAQTLRDADNLKGKLGSLADPGLAPSRTYNLLHGYSQTAIIANSLAGDSPVVRQHIQLFLDRLRYVRPALTGNDLIKMGFAPGPRMKAILERLHEARLDGKVTDKKEEEKLVKGWVAKESRIDKF
ncbi:MAG: CCA tRNA nucleotidyltransferase [Chloroflexi bacterium]|nr:CCA tRNA nucleotidyltransferase [Chloroflexota bacterium]